MRWTTLRQERGQAIPEFTNTFHNLCTKLGIKESKRNLVLKYRGALHKKWIFCTSHHSVLLIDMLLKLSRNLSTRTNGSSGLQIRNNQGMKKMNLIINFPKTIPRYMKRRVMGRQRRTPKKVQFPQNPMAQHR